MFHSLQENIVLYSWRPTAAITSCLTAGIAVLKSVSLERDLQET